MDSKILASMEITCVSEQHQLTRKTQAHLSFCFSPLQSRKSGISIHDASSGPQPQL